MQALIIKALQFRAVCMLINPCHIHHKCHVSHKCHKCHKEL